MELHKGIKGQPDQQPSGDHLDHQPLLPDLPYAKPCQAQWEKRPKIHRVTSQPQDTLVKIIKRPGQCQPGCALRPPCIGSVKVGGIQHCTHDDIEILQEGQNARP